MHLKHEFGIFVSKESKLLILGSFPSVKSREANFYYSHPRNRFFKLLYLLYNEEYSTSIEERKSFLNKHRIALYDVIYECDIEGSDDSSIRNVTPIDIEKILSEHPSIKKIAINGGKAKELFNKYLLSKVRGVEIVYLPSTSPANAKMSLDYLIDKYQEILK